MLDQILAHKRTEIARLNLAEQRAQALDTPLPRPFLPSPRQGEGPGMRGESRPRLIAELKRASPSRGLLAPHLDMLELARLYAANGAAAISVLTDEKFFLGSLDTLIALRSSPFASRSSPPPLLRKDFILSPAQLYETRAAGADAVLLIAAAVDDAELADLHALALELGLTPLVEVHTAEEVERVLRVPQVTLTGINNRNLATFAVSLETTAQLRPLIPAHIAVVSESGIFTAEHMARLAALNVDAALVGEALVTAPDIAAKVRELAASRQPLTASRQLPAASH